MREDKVCLDSKVELAVPATKEMMLVIRLTSAAVLARAGVSADKIDELKMAIEESAGCLIKCVESGTLDISFMRTCDNDMSILLKLSGSSIPSDEYLTGDEIDVIRCILAALTDSVNVTAENGKVSAIELKADVF